MEFNETLNLNSSKDFNISELLSADLTSKVPKVTFLLLFGVITIVGNAMLLLILFKGKKSIMTVLIINLCFVGLCECWLNMSMILGALFLDSWLFGDTMCRIHAFCMSGVFIELVLTLLCISIERFVAMKFCIDPKNYITIWRIVFIVMYTWIHAIAFSVPLLIGSVPVTYRPSLHLCSISDSSSLTYICLTSIVCFIIPILTMLILYLLVIRVAFKENKSVQTMISQNHYTEKKSSNFNLKQEIMWCKYGGVLFCTWFVLGVPYIISAYIRQYQYSYEFQKNNFQTLLNYSWTLDVAFLYLRFLFSAAFPILTFLIIKFLWSNLKDVLLCRRSNSIADVRSTKNTKNKKTVKKKSAGKSHVIRGPVAKVTIDQVFNVPVLFATSDGIHIETNDSENSTRSKSENDVLKVTESSMSVIPKGKHCDVVGPPELDYWHQDTSDYDSCGEIEVYSSSQPVSMRQATQDLLTQRSISQPEVCKSKTSHIVSLKDAKKSLASDSGLDLSISNQSLRQTFHDKINPKSNLKNSPQFHKTWAARSVSVNPTNENNSWAARSVSVSLANENSSWAARSVSVSPAHENNSQHKSAENIEKSVKKINETELNKQDKSKNKISESQTSEELHDQDPKTVLDQYLSVSQRVKRDSTSHGFSFLELQMDEKKPNIDHVTFTNANKTSLDENTAMISPRIVTHKPPRSAQKKSKSTEVKNLGETFNVPSKMADELLVRTDEPKLDFKVIPSKKGHQRHDTSDSQKSLLGSASSNELASMKEESFPKESLMKN